ncbi:MAG: beta family protein [Chitinophagaceae bacterium]|nr:beta family protein [Chitinophagaceae bacterium]
MISSFYTPVLKSKQGEFDALAKLDPLVKKYMFPLLEITSSKMWDNITQKKPKTIEDHLQNFCKKVIKKWPSNHFFIDTDLINNESPNGVSCIEYIFNILFENGIKPMPVVRISSPANLITGIKAIQLIYGLDEIAIRISIENITSPSFETELNELLLEIEMPVEKCHIILDLNSSDFTNTSDFADGILGALESFPSLKEWKSFTVCGGSFPPTNLIKIGINHIPRNEWKFYQELVKKLESEPFNRAINYGDYGIVAPGNFEFDPAKMSRSANIRYTHNDLWFVIKGKALKKSEDFKQYVAQTKDILKSGFYLGEPFSEGDAHIKKCSLGETTPGSPTVWNWVGNNHHFTKVVRDLFASYRAA